MSEVIGIDELYLRRTRHLRSERRALLQDGLYRAAITCGELAYEAERRGLDIRQRMPTPPQREE